MKNHFLFAFAAIGLLLASCDKEDTEYIYVNVDHQYAESLKKLDWGTNGEVTYVIGHKTPDCDAVFSAMAYSQLMKQMGYKCEAKVAGELNNETKYVRDLFGFTMPDVLNDASGQRMILVDHSEYAQAVDGLRNARILQIVDHHGLGDVTEALPLYIKAMPIGATCSIVYSSFKELDKPINDETARALLAGIVSDTRFLTKLTTTKMDSLACYNLMKQLNLSADSVLSLDKKMNDVSHDYYGMTDKEIFLSDYKDYKIEDVPLGIGSLDVYGEENAMPFLQRMLYIMPSVMKQKSAQMMFAKVDLHIRNTDPATMATVDYVDAGSYIVYTGEGAQQIAEACYGKSVAPGICYSEVKLSRKTDFVPALTEAFKTYKAQ